MSLSLIQVPSELVEGKKPFQSNEGPDPVIILASVLAKSNNPLVHNPRLANISWRLSQRGKSVSGKDIHTIKDISSGKICSELLRSKENREKNAKLTQLDLQRKIVQELDKVKNTPPTKKQDKLINSRKSPQNYHHQQQQQQQQQLRKPRFYIDQSSPDSPALSATPPMSSIDTSLSLSLSDQMKNGKKNIKNNINGHVNNHFHHAQHTTHSLVPTLFSRPLLRDRDGKSQSQTHTHENTQILKQKRSQPMQQTTSQTSLLSTVSQTSQTSQTSLFQTNTHVVVYSSSSSDGDSRNRVKNGEEDEEEDDDFDDDDDDDWSSLSSDEEEEEDDMIKFNKKDSEITKPVLKRSLLSGLFLDEMGKDKNSKGNNDNENKSSTPYDSHHRSNAPMTAATLLPTALSTHMFLPTKNIKTFQDVQRHQYNVHKTNRVELTHTKLALTRDNIAKFTSNHDSSNKNNDNASEYASSIKTSTSSIDIPGINDRKLIELQKKEKQKQWELELELQKKKRKQPEDINNDDGIYTNITQNKIKSYKVHDELEDENSLDYHSRGW